MRRDLPANHVGPTVVTTPRLVELRFQTAGVDAVVVGGDGRVLVRLSGYETVALPGTASSDLLGPLEAALR
jgi:hypothetical protein